MANKVKPRHSARPVQKTGRFAGERYKHSQRSYAESYGVSLITVKRWWKAGRPCDDVDAMGEFLSNAGRKPDFQEDPAPHRSPADPGSDADDRLAEERTNRLDEHFLAGEGLEGALKRITKIELALADALRDQLNFKRIRPQELRNRLAEWGSIIEAMRKLEKDAPGIFGDNKKTVDIAHAMIIQGKMLEAFARSIDALPGRAAAKLEGLDFHERQALLEREVEVIKRTLHECDYLADLGDNDA